MPITKMSQKYNQILLLTFAAALFVACQQGEIPEIKVYEVPAELEPYVDLFEQEAAKRGQNITIDNLRVLYEGDLLDGTAAGTCTYPHLDNPIPTIRFDTNSVNWTNNEYSREILVFHELGHCVLNRRVHRDDDLPNGNFASVMRSTGAQLYGGALNGFKRDYYLDELFDENTPPPDWATNMPAYGEINYGSNFFIDNFVDNRNRWNTGTSASTVSKIENGYFHFQSKEESTAFFISKDINLVGDTDFEVEAEMRISQGANSCMMQWGGSDGNNLYFMGMTPDKSIFLGNWQEGIVAAREIEDLNPSEFVKLTVRRIGNRYHIYVNQQYFDVLEYEGLFGQKIAFYVGPETTMQVEAIRVRELL
jgi:hypothetical protein